MRRRYLSHEELDQVIKLKQAGASWLKIQQGTGIPRRSAKRAYEDWQRSQSLEELKAARTQVAAQEFREHQEHLINLADALVEHLFHRVTFDETRDADKLLDDLWMKDIGEKLESLVSFRNKPEREQRRIVRQNQMLLEALKNHTREKVRWQALDEWKLAWTACVSILAELRVEAQETVANILNNQKPKVKNRIEKSKRGKDIVEEMTRGIVEAVWGGILAEKPEEGYSLIRTRPEGEETTVILFADQSSIVSIRLTENDLAGEVADICRWAAQNLCRGDLVQQPTGLISAIQARASELEVMLDPLRLRPLILRTRCELCPA